MSTTNQPPSTNLFTLLAAANGYINLAVTIAGTVVPLVVGIVKSVKSSGEKTVDFTVTVDADMLLLNNIQSAGEFELAEINAKLIAMGLPPMAIPFKPAAPPA